MESFLNRYRNITVLLLVICAQLVLLAVQVKNDQEVRIIRVWTVTSVTPAARLIEGLRGGSIGFIRNYILLRDASQENKRLQTELDRLKMENRYLRNELNTADRAQALAIFQAHTASKTLAASIIGTGAGSNSKLVFIDRGSTSGVQRGMAVVTPDGIVGKVISAYPTASEVLLVTDPDFAAGVVSQKNQSRGTLKGQGSPLCRIDYVPVEEKVEVGEWLYTSGDDRIFPKGFPVGVVKVVRNAQPFKEILVEPAGLQRGLEGVLVLLEGVHKAIPDVPPVQTQVYLAPAPPAENQPAAATPPPAAGNTEADKIRQRYKTIGDAQSHKYGDNPPGARVIDFNIKAPEATANQPAAATGSSPPVPRRTESSAQPAGPSPAGGNPAASKPSSQAAPPRPAAGSASGAPAAGSPPPTAGNANKRPATPSGAAARQARQAATPDTASKPAGESGDGARPKTQSPDQL